MDYVPQVTVVASSADRSVSGFNGAASAVCFYPSSSAPRPVLDRLQDFGVAVYSPESSALQFAEYEVLLKSALTSGKGSWFSTVGAHVSTEDKRVLNFIEQRLSLICCTDSAAVLDESLSRTAIRAVVDTVEDLLQDNDLVSLNELLASVDPSKLRKITSVALLRSSYRVSEKLSHWQTFYAGVYSHLKNTDQKPEKALRGLLRPRVTKIA